MAITDIIPWRRTPYSLEQTPLWSLQREMNRMFDEFWSNGGGRMVRSALQEGNFFPDVDIDESDKHVNVMVDVPGMSEKEIKLNLSDDGETLSIEGEKKVADGRKAEELFCSERRFGRFRRTVGLPSRVDPDQVEAKCKNGVLTIHMNKLQAKEQHIKEIPVKAG